jgi:type IV pilus assembly protein PilE
MTPNRQRGFTLIELMITVAIIAILSAVVYPSYASYVLRTNRSAAASCMTELGQFMERVYVGNLRYDQNNGAATTLPALQCSSDLSARYTFAFASGSPATTTYTLSAAPRGAQAGDTACGTLSLTQAGTKGVSGSSTVANCWR